MQCVWQAMVGGCRAANAQPETRRQRNIKRASRNQTGQARPIDIFPSCYNEVQTFEHGLRTCYCFRCIACRYRLAPHDGHDAAHCNRKSAEQKDHKLLLQQSDIVDAFGSRIEAKGGDDEGQPRERSECANFSHRNYLVHGERPHAGSRMAEQAAGLWQSMIHALAPSSSGATFG